MLKEFDLGSAGISYIRSSLATGFTLMRQVLGLQLEKGRVRTLLPEGVALKSLTEFSYGGVATGHRAAIEERVAELILDHLSAVEHSLVAFEDYNLDPGSKFLAGRQHFVYRSEVSLYIDSRSSPSADDVRRVMKQASEYTSRAVLTSAADETRLQCGQSVTMEFVRTLARNTQHILVGAYDEESYVIWTR